MNDIQDLIARVEAATGADRELDAEIHLFATQNTIASVADIMAGNELGYAHPAYTASIDVALMLVPDGHAWTIYGGDYNCPDSASLAKFSKRGQLIGDEYVADGGTPALAIVAAALKARAA